MSKKILALLLAAMMTLSFAACGDKEKPSDGDKPGQTTEEKVGYFVGDNADQLMKPLDKKENPNDIDMTALAVFKNAVDMQFGRATGRVERSDINTTYCTHGSMQAKSIYKLDYDNKGAKDDAAAVTATYSVAPNAEISDIVHYKLSCNSVPVKGTASAPVVGTNGALKETLTKLEGDMLSKGLSPEYVAKADLVQATNGEVTINILFTDGAQQKVTGSAAVIPAGAPKGTTQTSAKMVIDKTGKVLLMRVDTEIVDSTGTDFALTSSTYEFKKMAGTGTPDA